MGGMAAGEKTEGVGKKMKKKGKGKGGEEKGVNGIKTT